MAPTVHTKKNKSHVQDLVLEVFYEDTTKLDKILCTWLHAHKAKPNTTYELKTSGPISAGGRFSFDASGDRRRDVGGGGLRTTSANVKRATGLAAFTSAAGASSAESAKVIERLTAAEQPSPAEESPTVTAGFTFVTVPFKIPLRTVDCSDTGATDFVCT